MTVCRRLVIAGAVALMAFAAPRVAFAHSKHTQAGGPEQSTISGSAFQGASGSIKVNEAAGNGNAQANITVLSSGNIVVGLSQKVSGLEHDTGNATIGDTAFAGASGAIQLNQVAGSGNTQGNVIVLQLDGHATLLTDAALSNAVASPERPETDSHSSGGNSTSISSHAFSGASGVVQINQTAGTSNRTTNSFQLQLQPGPGT